MNIFNK